jgi:YcxB-like protein
MFESSEDRAQLVRGESENPPSAFQPERLEVTYRFTADDARRVGWWAQYQHPRLKRPLQVVLLLGLIAAGFAAWANGDPAFVVPLIVTLFFGCLWYPRQVARRITRQPGWGEQHTVWISPEAVGGRTTQVGEAKYEWHLAQQILDAPHYILLQWRSGATTIIPTRAFADPPSAARFVQAAKAWHAAATRPGRATGSELSPTHPPGSDQRPASAEPARTGEGEPP